MVSGVGMIQSSAVSRRNTSGHEHDPHRCLDQGHRDGRQAIAAGDVTGREHQRRQQQRADEPPSRLDDAHHRQQRREERREDRDRQQPLAAASAARRGSASAEDMAHPSADRIPPRRRRGRRSGSIVPTCQPWSAATSSASPTGDDREQDRQGAVVGDRGDQRRRVGRIEPADDEDDRSRSTRRRTDARAG